MDDCELAISMRVMRVRRQAVKQPGEKLKRAIHMFK